MILDGRDFGRSNFNKLRLKVTFDVIEDNLGRKNCIYLLINNRKDKTILKERSMHVIHDH